MRQFDARLASFFLIASPWVSGDLLVSSLVHNRRKTFAGIYVFARRMLCFLVSLSLSIVALSTLVFR